MNVRSKNLKTRNLPKHCKKIAQVNSKPYVFLTLFFVLGCILIAYKSYLMGCILIALCVYNLCFVKNTILVEFYEEYAVFYQVSMQKDECYLLFWEDIVAWCYVRTKTDYDVLEIKLKDGKEVNLNCISKHTTLHCFKRFVKVPQSKKSMHHIL